MDINQKVRIKTGKRLSHHIYRITKFHDQAGEYNVVRDDRPEDIGVSYPSSRLEPV